jgi:hypothetical protein
MVVMLNVTKLSANGPTLINSTFLGRGGNDDGLSIAIDGSGNAYVTGSTESTNSPTTRGGFDTSYNGSEDVFVSKMQFPPLTAVEQSLWPLYEQRHLRSAIAKTIRLYAHIMS